MVFGEEVREHVQAGSLRCPESEHPRGVVALSATARKDSPRIFTRVQRIRTAFRPRDVSRSISGRDRRVSPPYSCSIGDLGADGWLGAEEFWPAREKLPSFAISMKVVSWSTNP